LAFFLYSMIVGPLQSVPEAEEVRDENLVEIADELSGIIFRQDLFSTPGYKALVDFSAPLPAEPAGRTNPFEVIGRD
jgi:hypothetical protein